MAIVSARTSVASIGIGCQGSHQLESHADLIRDLVRVQRVKRVSTPFDWIICPAKSVARQIGAWRFHPDDLSELIEDETPYWPEARSWFWHGGPQIADGTFLDRRRRVTTNFEDFRRTERQVFILSNTQTSLEAIVASVRHGLDIVFNDDDLDAVETALQAQFPNPELWVVTRSDRHVLARRKDHPRVVEFQPDRTRWKGDDTQWADALRRILPLPA
jgi:hypothetical protein